MSKQTFINSQMWNRKDSREWCYTCGTWVKPLEKMGGMICGKCRRVTDPSPETRDMKPPKE